MPTEETAIEAVQVLLDAGMEDTPGYGQLTAQQAVYLLDQRGLLAENRVLQYTEEWGLMMCAGYPSDEEVEVGHTRESAVQVRDQIRRRIADPEEDGYEADDYEPMKIVRRRVPIHPKPPWEEVE